MANVAKFKTQTKKFPVHKNLTDIKNFNTPHCGVLL